MSLKTMGNFGKGGHGGTSGSAGTGAKPLHVDNKPPSTAGSQGRGMEARPSAKPAASVKLDEDVVPAGKKDSRPGTKNSTMNRLGSGDSQGSFRSSASVQRNRMRRKSSLLTSDTGAADGIMDAHGTAYKPAGPHPNPYEPGLVGWIKLEEHEYLCKAHDTTLDRITDSARREPMVVGLSYEKGSASIQVTPKPQLLGPALAPSTPGTRAGSLSCNLPGQRARLCMLAEC